MKLPAKDQKKYDTLSRRWACGDRKLTNKQMHFVLECNRKHKAASLQSELANDKAK
jgi:hypothetical protein